ncbi:MAG: sugar transferase, partial [Armatimonadota bacterium]|nr:sugar transferase [Armatimonadota bacterium]
TQPLRHLGKLSDLASVLDREVVDEVVIVRSQTDLVPHGPTSDTSRAWGDILELCLQRGRTVSLVDDIVPPVHAKVEATMMGTLPTLVLHNTPQNTLALAAKNIMDRMIALIALIVLALPMAVIALLIKLQDRGPVFFAQERVGLNGRKFKFFKFRSMAVNAQEILERMKREEPERYRAINVMEEPFFKAREGEDPRITPVGRFIRKYSLDELPQFWNVLKGDMSLVGPRPPLPKEVEQLEPWQRRKLSVKGGLTCIWQASGRNEITDVDEWMRLDLEYIDNWSLWLDIKLLFKTLKVLIKPKGAS